MRIWDIHPGYLNRQSLLGEHRELHGIVSIIKNNKKGYSRHPETIRWLKHGWAIKQRHKLLAAEMSLRGYKDSSPVDLRSNKYYWPDTYIDIPFQQIAILKNKYAGKEPGRIPLPGTPQELWNHHKFSVLARDEKTYQHYEKYISGFVTKQDFLNLTDELTIILRTEPSPEGMDISLKAMWSNIPSSLSGDHRYKKFSSIRKNLHALQLRIRKERETTLQFSTALSELAAWLPG